MEGSTNRDTVALGVTGTVRTHRRTLELAGRVGQKKWGILIDSGSTGNFISAQVCTASRLKVEEDPDPEELTLADGSRSQTEGRVHLKIKCGGYQGVIQAKVFPGLHKPVILGIPWLRKENPHINWAQEVVVVKQKGNWITLPLMKKDTGSEAEVVNMVSAKAMRRILEKRNMLNTCAK